MDGSWASPLPPLRRQLSWHFNKRGSDRWGGGWVGPASRINLRASCRRKRCVLSLSAMSFIVPSTVASSRMTAKCCYTAQSSYRSQRIDYTLGRPYRVRSIGMTNKRRFCFKARQGATPPELKFFARFVIHRQQEVTANEALCTSCGYSVRIVQPSVRADRYIGRFKWRHARQVNAGSQFWRTVSRPRSDPGWQQPWRKATRSSSEAP
jgi:hypothetical protein